MESLYWLLWKRRTLHKEVNIPYLEEHKQQFLCHCDVLISNPGSWRIVRWSKNICWLRGSMWDKLDVTTLLSGKVEPRYWEPSHVCSICRSLGSWCSISNRQPDRQVRQGSKKMSRRWRSDIAKSEHSLLHEIRFNDVHAFWNKFVQLLKKCSNISKDEIKQSMGE